MYRILLIEDGTYLYNTKHNILWYSFQEVQKIEGGRIKIIEFTSKEEAEQNLKIERLILFNFQSIIVSEHPEMFEIVEVPDVIR